jgi:uncharacterized membrane protein
VIDSQITVAAIAAIPAVIAALVSAFVAWQNRRIHRLVNSAHAALESLNEEYRQEIRAMQSEIDLMKRARRNDNA